MRVRVKASIFAFGHLTVNAYQIPTSAFAVLSRHRFTVFDCSLAMDSNAIKMSKGTRKIAFQDVGPYTYEALFT